MIQKLNLSKMNENIRYVHEEIVHNFKAANEVVPFILQLLNPKSIVDVGCGIGTWLKVFEDNGIIDVLGIDGCYVDKNLLKIDKAKFVDFDLEKLYHTDIKFDLAISLEVAEHLSLESADIFVKTIANLSDTVIFSAAIPYQGGQNHINEQEPKYWIEKFENEGFKLFDVLRPVFWDNSNVDSWYRQNMLLFTKNIDLKANLDSLESFSGKHLVHPVLSLGKDNSLNYYVNQVERINAGNKDVRFYLSLLLKALKRKFI
jgi:SAM-dependent methyltransferase